MRKTLENRVSLLETRVDYIDKILDKIRTDIDNSLLKTGTIILSREGSNIEGFLPCNGSLIKRDQCPNLFDYLTNQLNDVNIEGYGKYWYRQSSFNDTGYIATNQLGYMSDNLLKFMGQGCFVVKNKVYMLGGMPENRTLSYDSPESLESMSDTIRVGEIGTDSRIERFKNYAISLPVALSGFKTLVIGKHVYIFGGIMRNGKYNRDIYRATILVDGTITSFVKHMTLPFEIHTFDIAYIKNKVYLIVANPLTTSREVKFLVYESDVLSDLIVGFRVSNSRVFYPISDGNIRFVKVFEVKNYLYLVTNGSVLRAAIYEDGDTVKITNFKYYQEFIKNSYSSDSDFEILTTKNKVYVLFDEGGNVREADIDAVGDIDPFVLSSTRISSNYKDHKLVVTKDYLYVIGGYSVVNGSLSTGSYLEISFSGGYNDYSRFHGSQIGDEDVVSLPDIKFGNYIGYIKT
ncbi:MAG: hypothetical protein QXF12_05095 [Candidatus Aenigmatarchaeota archaeon]